MKLPKEMQKKKTHKHILNKKESVEYQIKVFKRVFQGLKRRFSDTRKIEYIYKEPTDYKKSFNLARFSIIWDKEKIQVIAGNNVRYVVPQIINNRYLDSITLYFRVQREQKDAFIVVSDKKKQIFEKKERIVKPPEMIKITLSKKSL